MSPWISNTGSNSSEATVKQLTNLSSKVPETWQVPKNLAKSLKNLGRTCGRAKIFFPVATAFDHFEKNILTSDFSSRNKRLPLGYERKLRLRLVALTQDFGCNCISVELGRLSTGLGPWCPWHWREEVGINKPNLPLSTASPWCLSSLAQTLRTWPAGIYNTSKIVKKHCKEYESLNILQQCYILG